MFNGLGKALLDYETAITDMETAAENGVRDFYTLVKPMEEARLKFESVWHVANMLQLVTGKLHLLFLMLPFIYFVQDRSIFSSHKS